MEHGRIAFDTAAPAVLSGILSPFSAAERRTFSEGKPGWFHKELIRESEYIHPVYGWRLEVTKENLNRWAEAFAAMTLNGHEIPVPDGHLWTVESNRGYLREVYVAENEDGAFSLFGWLEILNREAARGIRDGTINHVSIALGKAVVDGLGNNYGEAIEHCCLTNYPVAHNTGPFAEAVKTMEAAQTDGRRVLTFSRDAGATEFAVSDRPWAEVRADQLPASAHLHVGNQDDPSTWQVPVYEGSGPLVEGAGGRKVHKARGNLNRHGVRAAADAIDSVPDGRRAVVAKKLAGLFRQIGEEPPEAIRTAAGMMAASMAMDGCFSFEVAGGLKMVAIPRLRDIVKEEEAQERLNRAIWAFRDLVERVAASEDMTQDEKRAKLTEAISDLQDIVAPEVRADLLAAVLGPNGLNLTTKETRPMDEKLLALCAALGITVADPKATPSADFLQTVFAKAREAAESRATLTTQVETVTRERDDLRTRLSTSEEGENRHLETLAAKDPAVKKLLDAKVKAEKDAQEIRRREQRTALATRHDRVEALAKAGTLTEDGVKAARALLGVHVVAPAFTFGRTADGKDDREVLESAEVDVPKTVLALLDSLPEGACLDVKERTRRTAGRTLTAVGDTREDENAEVKAYTLAAENLMATGQPVTPKILSRLPDALRKKAEEWNTSLNGAARR